jgi:crossover junction endodeoxyribonuclease RuvC
LAEPLRILGVDPGSGKTGYGVIDHAQGHSRHIASGFLKLLAIAQTLQALIKEHQPDCGVVEAVFFAHSPRTAIVLGHVRGVALLQFAAFGIPIHEYSPTEIKQAIVGMGRAEKSQVQHMVRILLNHQGTLQEDEADALAVAITHAHRIPNYRIRD